MKWAFWRREKAERATANASARRSLDNDEPRSDPTAALRVRARRRLIGAAALLLAAVILIPMILDPEPRPVVDTVPIEIPSEKTPFSPRLSLPPVPDPGNVPVAPPPDTAAPADEAKAAEGAAADKPEKPADKPDEKAAEKPATKAPARPTTEARPREAKAGGRILLQAAALGSEGAARELVDRLKAAGFAPTIERVATKEGVRWRVRVGPYATRDESERAREQLKALGINAVRVAPEK